VNKVHGINPDRLAWCCEQQGMTVIELAERVGIAPATLARAMEGEDALSVRQLEKVAAYFQRGLLFFLEAAPVDARRVSSAQFRTLRSRKPELSPKLTALVQRMERQRQVFLSLLDDLGEDADRPWYPAGLDVDAAHIKASATRVRNWLGLQLGAGFAAMRQAVERKGLLVFLTNGYQGPWQISRESPIRGFSLYFDNYPVIAIKKQDSEGPQAFTLMHELGHLLLHRDSFIDDEDDFHGHRGKERVANAFAGNLLVPDRALHEIHLDRVPVDDVKAYDAYLRDHAKRWTVSVEVILRRLADEGHLPVQRYQAYREWKASLPRHVPSNNGYRYRFKEPERMFGEPFVRTVLDALHSKHISLAKASSYLDNLKITDLRRLEATHARL
jgi:Zn-dependent peptidase ImmA (M78 family)